MSLFEANSKNFKLSGLNNNTITTVGNHKNWHHAIYTNTWILSNSNKIVRWKIRNNHTENGNLGIAIITNKHHHKVNQDIDANGCYMYVFGGTIYKDGRGLTETSSDKKQKLLQGQTAIFTLDCKQKQIRICINDGQDHILFDNISTNRDIKYKLAIGMYHANDSITVSLENGDTEEQKQNQQDADRDRIMELVQKISKFEQMAKLKNAQIFDYIQKETLLTV